jgi:hypothetical protein
LELAERILESTETFIAVSWHEQNKSHQTRSVQHVRNGLKRARLLIAEISLAGREPIYEKLNRLEKTAAILEGTLEQPSNSEESVLDWAIWDTYEQRVHWGENDQLV